MAGEPKTVFFCCSLYQVDIHVKCLIFPRQFIILQLINNSINFYSKRTVNKARLVRNFGDLPEDR